jgi:hypothetical protein
MDQTRLVVIEDSGKGHIVINQLFGKDGLSEAIPNLQLDRELSLPFTEQIPEENRATLDRVRKALDSCQGPMLLALDLDLGLGEESGKIRGAVRQLTEEKLGREIPGEIDRQVDGLLIAVEAINQSRIKPLLVVIQTSRGLHDQNRNLLQEFTKRQNREHEVKVIVSTKYLSSPDANSTYVASLFNDAQKAFQEFFGGQLAKFFQMLDEGTDDTTHNNLDKNPKAEATRVLTVLLDLSEQDFLNQIWETWKQNLTKPVTETVKTMGIKERERLSASAGWFFALAAFRHSKDPRDWQEVFDINQLVAGLETSYLTPPQSETTLRRTIICFYEMCLALFKSEEHKEGKPQPGPLVAVTLTKDEGLRMLLNFDCAPAPDESKPKSLYEQVGRWRNNSGGWHQMNKAEDARITSRSIWRFWLATSVGDKPLPHPEYGGSAGVFGSNSLWRMNIFRRPAGRSEVVFNVK